MRSGAREMAKDIERGEVAEPEIHFVSGVYI